MAKAFFTVEKKKIQTKVETKQVGCVSCGLYKECNTPKMDYGGLGEKKILIITDYTTKGEDQTGRHFANASHKFMISEFAAMGIDVEKDCWKVAAVRCKPEFNKKGEIAPLHINACRNKLLATIKELKPEKIVVMGKVALDTLIGHRVTARLSVAHYDRWWNWVIPDQELETLIYPIFDPTFMLSDLYERKRKMKKSGWFVDEPGSIWEHSKLSQTDDFIIKKLFYRKQIKRISEPKKFRKFGYQQECSVILNVNEAISFLNQIEKEGNDIAFDFETTGIKPHREGHKLLTVAISNGIISCGMPFFNNEEFRQKFKNIMLSKKIGKIMHNAKYELIWTYVLLGYWIENVVFDPMLSSHVLDNRQGITSLKMQTYVNFGYIYDNDVEQFMTSKEGEDPKSCNSFNRVDEADIYIVCYYNAQDSHYTFHLKELHTAQLDQDRFLWRGFLLHLNATPVLAEIEQYGLKVDEERLLKNERKLESMMIRIANKIESSEEVKKWYEVHKEPFNFGSGPQLAELLYKILGFTPTKFTDTGQPSTDVDALGDLKDNSLFVRYILGHKKIEKVKNTFLAGIRRETVKGILHPGYNLNTVVTYRTSSSNPNWQNIPKHDRWSNNIIRSVIIPRSGRVIMELDYSSLEVSVNADYSLDHGLFKILFDKDFDFHRASAADIFMIPESEVTKKQRQQAKGNMSFSAFYGSGYRLIANNFWYKAFTKEDKAHLAEKGIHNFDAFEQHVKKSLDIFQNIRFKDHWAWRNSTWKKYLRTGEVIIKTGFKVRNLCNLNQAGNAGPQGSGSHFLIYGLIQLHKMLKKSKAKANILGQIHDSLLVEVDIEELDKVMRMAKLCMVDKVKAEYPFEKVGLGVDADVYGTTWAKKDYGMKVAERISSVQLSA